MTTLQPHLHSSLSIATCLGRSRLLASRLSPFLPASDPRLWEPTGYHYQTHARGRRCHSTTWRVGLHLHGHSVVKDHSDLCRSFFVSYDTISSERVAHPARSRRVPPRATRRHKARKGHSRLTLTVRRVCFKVTKGAKISM
jgi:hypothetical protein